MRQTTPTPSVAIVGGGPAGLAMALALHQQGILAEIHDARPRGAAFGDPRTLALAHGSRLILEALNTWNGLSHTPIDSIHVSQRHSLGRTLLSAAQMRVPALGYVVAAGNLARNLDSLCRKLAIPFHQNSPVTAQSLPAAQLTIWAEGRIDADEVRSRDYAQHAVICNVQSSVPHQQRAWERFTEDGPLALLPCDSDSGIAVVLTCPSAAVAELTGLADNEFIDLLEERIGKRLRFVSASARQSFPLALRYREQVTGIRQVWIGNAAQTLHPVAGQGFNLSLRDIHTLADCLCDAVDPGDSALLDRYCARRRIDRLATIGFTDSLVRIFGVGNPLVRHVRGSALIALDLIPPARAFLARRMMFGARGG